MANDAELGPSDIEIRRSRIYFFYNFLTTHIPLSASKSPSRGAGAECFGAALQSSANNLWKDDYKAFEYHRAEEKEPVEYRSDVYIKFPHLSITTNEFPTTPNAEGISIKFEGSEHFLPGRLHAHLALFESGLVTIGLILDINLAEDKEPLDYEKLTSICNTDEKHFKHRHPDSVPTHIYFEGMKPSLFQFALHHVNGLLNRISEQGKAFFPKPDFDPKFREGYLCTHKHPDCPAGNSYCRADCDERLTRPEPCPLNPDDCPAIDQEPYIVVILSVRRTVLEALATKAKTAELESAYRLFQCMKDRHVPKRHRVIINNSLNPEKREFHNLIDDSRFHVCVFQRTMGILIDEGLPIADPQVNEVLLRGIFRLLVAVRGRWYTYLILNTTMNKSIFNLYSEFLEFTEFLESTNGKKPNWQKIEEKRKETLKKIIGSKVDFAREVSIEDPLIHGVGLSPLVKVFDTLHSMFRVKDLRSEVIAKLREYDSIYEKVDQYWRSLSRVSAVKESHPAPRPTAPVMLLDFLLGFFVSFLVMGTPNTSQMTALALWIVLWVVFGLLGSGLFYLLSGMLFGSTKDKSRRAQANRDA